MLLEMIVAGGVAYYAAKRFVLVAVKLKPHAIACAYLGHIGADIRACDLLFLRCACPTSLLGFFYIFEPGSLLCLRWLFTLRNIGPVFRLKYVSLNMFGL